MCFHVFSKFGDIFDEDHFIESLRKHVRVVKELPEDVFLRFDYNISTIPNMRTKAFSPPSYYLQQVLPKMLELGYVLLPFFPFLEVMSDTWNLGMPCTCLHLFFIPWHRAIRIAPFSNRLAHSVPSDVQSLRCLANYEALRFSESIRILGENMVDRMIKRSSLTGGKYVSVHLRFEEVLLKFILGEHILLLFSLGYDDCVLCV